MKKNKFEDLRKNKHRNDNEYDKTWTVADLVREINDKIPEIKIDRNKINRIENGSQEPDAKTLIAYSKVFNVSVDYLLGLSKSKAVDKDMKMICDYTGLSDETIETIRNLSYLDKIILDKIICDSCLFTKLIQDTKRILAFNAFHSDVKIVFDENAKKYDKGIAILENTINSGDITRSLYGIIDEDMHNLLNSLLNDAELTNILTTHFLESSVKNLLPNSELPYLGENIDETAKNIMEK